MVFSKRSHFISSANKSPDPKSAFLPDIHFLNAVSFLGVCQYHILLFGTMVKPSELVALAPATTPPLKRPEISSPETSAETPCSPSSTGSDSNEAIEVWIKHDSSPPSTPKRRGTSSHVGPTDNLVPAPPDKTMRQLHDITKTPPDSPTKSYQSLSSAPSMDEGRDFPSCRSKHKHGSTKSMKTVALETLTNFFPSPATSKVASDNESYISSDSSEAMESPRLAKYIIPSTFPTLSVLTYLTLRLKTRETKLMSPL